MPWRFSMSTTQPNWGCHVGRRCSRHTRGLCLSCYSWSIHTHRHVASMDSSAPLHCRSLFFFLFPFTLLPLGPELRRLQIHLPSPPPLLFHSIAPKNHRNALPFPIPPLQPLRCAQLERPARQLLTPKGAGEGDNKFSPPKPHRPSRSHSHTHTHTVSHPGQAPDSGPPNAFRSIGGAFKVRPRAPARETPGQRGQKTSG